MSNLTELGAGRARRADPAGPGVGSGHEDPRSPGTDDRPPSERAASGVRTAVVTGGSSGIGAATGKRLRAEGFEVVLGARRLDRLREVARAIGARALPLDVTDPGSVEAFAEAAGPADVLVNNAGGALGLEEVSAFDEAKWRWMWEANVAGVARVTRAFLPTLGARGNGHVVVIGSIAGEHTYSGGGGYTAAKHAARAVTETLRLELLGRPIRVTEVDPGMVETEFSLVRFDGDQARAAAVYEGMTPLDAADVADCVAWAVTRPAHVNVDRIVVMPRDQAGPGLVARRQPS